MVSEKFPFRLELAILPPSPNIKDVDQATDVATNDWTVPSPPPNPKDDWGFHDCDEPPPLVDTTLAT